MSALSVWKRDGAFPDNRYDFASYHSFCGMVKKGAAGNYYLEASAKVKFDGRLDDHKIRINSSPFVRVTLETWGGGSFQFKPEHCHEFRNVVAVQGVDVYDSVKFNGYTFMLYQPTPVLWSHHWNITGNLTFKWNKLQIEWVTDCLCVRCGTRHHKTSEKSHLPLRPCSLDADFISDGDFVMHLSWMCKLYLFFVAI